jgi:DNA polymerase IIIc chi subunit
MNIPQKPKLIFLSVANNKEKLKFISDIVAKHFHQAEPILILVASDEAALYIDQLLWKSPEESFIPHAIVHATSKERVAISKSKSNFNQAAVLINLRPDAAVEIEGVHIIYDLIDLTHSSKEELSHLRQKTYESAGYSI